MNTEKKTITTAAAFLGLKPNVKRIEITTSRGETFFFYVRGLPGHLRDSWEVRIYQHGNDESRESYRGLKAQFLAMVLCASDGSPLFDLSEAEKINEVVDGDVINRIYDEASAWNGYGDEALEEIAGKSEGDRSAESGSPSPHISD